MIARDCLGYAVCALLTFDFQQGENLPDINLIEASLLSNAQDKCATLGVCAAIALDRTGPNTYEAIRRPYEVRLREPSLAY